MLKLMKLELRKVRIAPYIRAAFIANLVIIGFLCAIFFSGEAQNGEFSTFKDATTLIDMLVRGTYVVFAAVLISRFIIDEFRNKTIAILFMYPISRKKLMVAKLTIIVIFTFIMCIVSNLFVGAGLMVIDSFVDIVPGKLTVNIVLESLASIATSAFAMSFLSLIPLYFGLRKYSSVTTIVSSLILLILVSQSSGDFSMYSFIAVPIGLALIGASVAYFSIRNIDQVDIL